FSQGTLVISIQEPSIGPSFLNSALTISKIRSALTGTFFSTKKKVIAPIKKEATKAIIANGVKYFRSLLYIYFRPPLLESIFQYLCISILAQFLIACHIFEEIST